VKSLDLDDDHEKYLDRHDENVDRVAPFPALCVIHAPSLLLESVFVLFHRLLDLSLAALELASFSLSPHVLLPLLLLALFLLPFFDVELQLVPSPVSLPVLPLESSAFPSIG
jgi:hypothetical protein